MRARDARSRQAPGRPVDGRGLVVALDGPGSSGKSTVGALAAARLGYRFCDTGLLYRAVTWLALQRGTPLEDGAALAGLVAHVTLAPDTRGRLSRVRVDGRPARARIHVARVERHVSQVSAHPAVRAALLPRQRELAVDGSIVMAGRDIGTVVLPNADLKLFLDASVEERARRRADERGAAPDSPEAAAILGELRRRDRIDSTRAVAPLRVAPDAVIVRSDGRTIDETVEAVVAAVRERAVAPHREGARR